MGGAEVHEDVDPVYGLLPPPGLPLTLYIHRSADRRSRRMVQTYVTPSGSDNSICRRERRAGAQSKGMHMGRDRVRELAVILNSRSSDCTHGSGGCGRAHTPDAPLTTTNTSRCAHILCCAVISRPHTLTSPNRPTTATESTVTRSIEA